MVIVFSKAKTLNLGYGFVDFNTKEDAVSFINKINGMILLDKKLKVSWARGFFLYITENLN
jgi:RNA recognition motif-containing protein